MSTISLEARKRLIAENISIVDDASVIEKIESVLKRFAPSINRFTVEELEQRAEKSEQAIKDGRVYSTNEIRDNLGLWQSKLFGLNCILAYDWALPAVISCAGRPSQKVTKVTFLVTFYSIDIQHIFS